MNNEIVNINDEREVRLKKMEELIAQGINPYPASVNRKQTVSEALKMEEGQSVSIAGRLMSKRDMGKLTFCHLQDESGKIQVVFQKEDDNSEQYTLFLKKIDIADIVSIQGERFITHKGEQSVLIKKWQILTKALLPLPDKFHGLKDEDTRYRKRYLDFLMNQEEKQKMLVRSNILRYMREFLNSQGFYEVETPILESIASGAMAETFDTHLNAYDLPVHLRICVGELWQKRLLVGGFEKTFEIGRAFRNEGVDHSHNPEFTMMEFYWAYADYEDNMRLHEEMLPFIVKNSVGSLQIKTEDGEEIDFTPPYPRITFREAILKHTNIDINDYPTKETVAAIMKEHGYEVDPKAERGKLLDHLYKQSARLKMLQPTFVLEYPVELKPLAKKASDPRYTEMFQLIVKGFELSNSYTELNDPVDQRERFEEQARNAALGDEEAMAYDYDYVEALEHGMPPATGTGIGIDRFAALITGSHTLREVTAFPFMKPADSGSGINDTLAVINSNTKKIFSPTEKQPDEGSYKFFAFLNSKIESGKLFNALGHATVGLAAKFPDLSLPHFVQYEDKERNLEALASHFNYIALKADNSNKIKQVHEFARENRLIQNSFTSTMTIGTTNEQTQATAAVLYDELEFYALVIYCKPEEIQSISRKFSLWK